MPGTDVVGQNSRAFTHRRQHLSVLADLERQTLVAIARRLPCWITSDHLSAFALGCMFAAGAAFASFRLSPIAGFVVVVALLGNWFGDSLDGTVARVRRHERPRYGFYVDHVIDIAGSSLLLGGIAMSGLMHPLLAVALLAGFLLVAAETYLSTIADGVFRISFAGVGPTELRILIAAGAIHAIRSPWITVALFGRQRLFDVGGTVALVGLAGAFIWSAVRQTRALYVAEPLPVQTAVQR